MSPAGVIALRREQGVAAANAVFTALQKAGSAGLTPSQACAASGLPQRRFQRAVVRLEAENRVRRDGRRRLFAVVDETGRSISLNDAQTKIDIDRKAALTFAITRDWTLGELNDALRMLDNRRMPIGAGAAASALQGGIRELIRQIKSTRSITELDTLINRSTPIITKANDLLLAVEHYRQQLSSYAAIETWDNIKQKDRLHQLDKELRKIRKLIDQTQNHVTPLEYIEHKWIDQLALTTILDQPLFIIQQVTQQPLDKPQTGLLSGLLGTVVAYTFQHNKPVNVKLTSPFAQSLTFKVSGVLESPTEVTLHMRLSDILPLLRAAESYILKIINNTRLQMFCTPSVRFELPPGLSEKISTSPSLGYSP